jgi:hypothetical protein
MGAPRKSRRPRRQRLAGDLARQVDAAAPRQRFDLRRGIGVAHLVVQAAIAGKIAHPRRQPVEVHLAAPRMQVHRPLRHLRELAEAAGHRHPVDRMGAKIFQHAADEVAHVDQCRIVQAVKPLDGGFRGRAGGPGHVAQPGGARHVDALMNGGNPRRARKRMHDPGGAEDRQTAEDAEARVPGFLRQRLSARHRNLDLHIAGRAMLGRKFGDHGGIIRRGAGLMAGSPGGTGSPGLVTVPTPGPARNVTPEPAGPARTVTTISAPCVTSGSSPASLTIPARAQPSRAPPAPARRPASRPSAGRSTPDRETPRPAMPHTPPCSPPWRTPPSSSRAGAGLQLPRLRRSPSRAPLVVVHGASLLLKAGAERKRSQQ